MSKANRSTRSIAFGAATSRRVWSCLFSFSIAFSFVPRAWACGPFLPAAVTINGIHPDLPLRFFACGNLGVVQPGYAKSYLIVAYRYLSGQPLTSAEQASILRVWHRRLSGMSSQGEFDVAGSGRADRSHDYVKLRAKVLGSRPDNNTPEITFSQNVLADAFSNAAKTLQELITEFGLRSANVTSWLTAQDKLFESDVPSESDFPPLPADAGPIVRQQRAYQIAAAQFYSNDLDKARGSFEAIANDKTLQSNAQGLHLRDLCSYMAARCTVNLALAGNDGDQIAAAETYVRDLIRRNPHNAYRGDLDDLLDKLAYESEAPAESLDRLVKRVADPHGNRFGNAIADLTFLIHSYFDDHGNRQPQDSEDKTPPLEVPVEKYDLTDWLITIHQPDETWEFLGVSEKKQLQEQQAQRGLHALERWRKTHSLPWFVAALSLNDLLDKNNRDLFQAATKTTMQSKAFHTAQFYVIDALIRSGRMGEANTLLAGILAHNNMPPSARNLFMCQRLLASRSVNEYLNNIAQRPVAITTDLDPAQLPDDWEHVESRPNFYSIDQVIAETQSDDLNANLPQSYWIRWCQDKTLPASLRSRILLATWLRSKLLEREANLDDQLVDAYPFLKKAMMRYKDSHDNAEKRFALACLVIGHWGMTPYLEPGVSRHESKLNEWDGFNANFWLPLPPKPPTGSKVGSTDNPVPHFYEYLGSSVMRSRLQSYSKPALRALLAASDRKQADAERLAIWNNHPSKFLGDAILSWAKSHPKDQRVPEMLYHLVKLPRWSPGRSEIGTKYSREAYLLLHKQYPNNPWSIKAEYWY